MTRIRTTNNRRRAMAARRTRNRILYVLDLETRGLDGSIAPLLGRIKYMRGDADAGSTAPLPLPSSVDDIQRIIASFTEGTLPIPGFHPRLDLIHHLRTVDDASRTSHASTAEGFGAIAKDKVPPYFPTRHRTEGLAGDGFAEFGNITAAERALLDRTLALFAAPDRGMDADYAEWASRQPTYDEYVAGLPDGLPASDEAVTPADPG